MGNVLTKEDARGKIWEYEYDLAGRLETITDPLDNVSQLFYDEVGNKVRDIDAESRETRYEYDSRSNLIKSIDALDNETLFEYNTDGKLIKQTDPEGKVVNYVYDNEGRLLSTIDGNGNEIQMEYDDSTGTGCSSCSGGGSSQPSRIIYPTFSKEFEYDSRGRKTKEIDILSDTESYETLFVYDEAGNLISKTDKEGKVTQYEYDELNRLEKVIDPLLQETEYVYDARDNLFSLKDAKGNVTYFEYDRNNRLVKETRPMGEETNYAYDEVGNLIEKADPKGQKTEYIYDDTGKLLTINYFNPSDLVNPVKNVLFTYDKVGNLETYDDGTTTGEYIYDELYRKTQETVDYGTFSKNFWYTYYKNGLKKSFTGPDGVAYDYTYDANNQLSSVAIPGQGSITYSSYEWTRPASITLPGGATKECQYDPLMRVKEITSKDPGQNVLLNYSYNYDKMDNILTRNTEHGTYSYNYDDLYRLISSIVSTGESSEAFTYDQVGNRLTSAEAAGDWTYNDNNELMSLPGLSGQSSFAYDANGNMTQKVDSGVTTTYVYNLEDRLSEVQDSTGSLIAEYYYDPFGRRLWKDVGGTITHFLYADEGLVGEYDGTGVEIKTYGYKPGSTWTTDPSFMKINSNYYFYHNDHLGTPQKMTSVNGAVVWSAKYSTFGVAEIEITSTITNNLRFPGQYEDQETGLYYNWNRYYCSSIGRYLRSDPIGTIGNPVCFYKIRRVNFECLEDSIYFVEKNTNHLYTYVENNPDLS